MSRQGRDDPKSAKGGRSSRHEVPLLKWRSRAPQGRQAAPPAQRSFFLRAPDSVANPIFLKTIFAADARRQQLQKKISIFDFIHF